jgi:hypothetical protein
VVLVMVFDRNPKYGADQSFSEGAKRVTDLLWETTGGDLSSAPLSYLENLRHEYSNGKVSMLELMDRVDLGQDATYEDYCEVFDALLEVDPDRWPNPESVLSVDKDSLLYEIEPEFSEFDEVDFAEGDEDMSSKMETFLKKVISSVYLDGVSEVTDTSGDPPNSSNNYLLSDDGKEFSGVFHGSTEKGKKTFPFTITDNNGQWSIKY